MEKEKWKSGIMEKWNCGIVQEWRNGKMKCLYWLPSVDGVLE